MPRRVLATLLLQNGRAVSTTLLAEELWDGRPPRLARKTVQTHLYQVRKALTAGTSPGRRPRLETLPNGYRILLDPDEFDLRVFERQVTAGRAALAEGDHAGASGVLGEALGLWRGSTLGDIPHGPVLAPEVTRLEEARLGVLEQRVEADLHLGRHRELISELMALTALHPTREEFSAQLMLAAYRSGLREEALSCYARLRQNLVAQTGLEPSERLRRLHQDVLASVRDLSEPARVPRARATVRVRPAELPANRPDFVGRRFEVDQLRQSTGRRYAVTSLYGGPGVGKTTLALHVAHLVKDRYPDGQFFVTLHRESGSVRPPVAVLQSFLRAAGVGEPPSSLEEATRRFRSWTADRKVLVVIDDAASVRQASPLLPSGPDCATLITSRPRLAGLPGAVSMQLGPMSLPDGLELLGSLAGAGRVGRERDAARDLVELCDRLPLAVQIAGERLAARPGLGLGALAERMRAEAGRLDELRVGDLAVRHRLTEALRRLDRPERTALQALAWLGAGAWEVGEIGRWLGLSRESADQLAERLEESHLLVADAGAGQSGSGQPGSGPMAALRIPDLIRLAAVAEPDCRTAADFRPRRPEAGRLTARRPQRRAR
jgi:DNA-binding SARP family transcriptional activator